MPTEQPPAFRIERFDAARHDRADFDCGVGRLNHYLKLSARRQQNHDMTRVYVIVKGETHESSATMPSTSA